MVDLNLISMKDLIEGRNWTLILYKNDYGGLI